MPSAAMIHCQSWAIRLLIALRAWEWRREPRSPVIPAGVHLLCRRWNNRSRRIRVRHLLQADYQRVGIHRLHQMLVEAGFARAATIVVLSVAGDGDDVGLVEPLLPQPATDLEAVQARQPEVEQHHVRLYARRDLER